MCEQFLRNISCFQLPLQAIRLDIILLIMIYITNFVSLSEPETLILFIIP